MTRANLLRTTFGVAIVLGVLFGEGAPAIEAGADVTITEAAAGSAATATKAPVEGAAAVTVSVSTDPRCRRGVAGG